MNFICFPRNDEKFDFDLDLEVDLYTSKYGMLIRENTAQKTQPKLILRNNVGSCTRVFALMLTDKNLAQRYGNLKCI